MERKGGVDRGEVGEWKSEKGLIRRETMRIERLIDKSEDTFFWVFFFDFFTENGFG
jgi:hypothetical protein